MHSGRVQRHGSPALRSGVREKDLKPYVERYDLMMARYRNTKATEVALLIAHELLHYSATQSYSWQRQLQGMLEHVRNEGATAADLLRRVVIHYMHACDHPERIKHGINAEDAMLGRGVMRLAPLQKRGQRWAAVPLRNLGFMCRDGLYMFARGMRDRWLKDQETKEERRRATLDFDTPAAVSIEPTPASTRYRRTARGVQ
jgi:hypothetical protein